MEAILFFWTFRTDINPHFSERVNFMNHLRNHDNSFLFPEGFPLKRILFSGKFLLHATVPHSHNNTDDVRTDFNSCQSSCFDFISHERISSSDSFSRSRGFEWSHKTLWNQADIYQQKMLMTLAQARMKIELDKTSGFSEFRTKILTLVNVSTNGGMQ